MESLLDSEWLGERGWIAAGAAHANPMAPLRLLQSGTLANDIYRKNAYVSCYVHRDSLPKNRAEGKGGKGARKQEGDTKKDGDRKKAGKRVRK